jgi:hypothetical protein
MSVSDTVAQLGPFIHSLPVLGRSLIPETGEDRLQDNTRDHRGRGRETQSFPYF